jgi:dipeptidyl-peptidase-4
MRIPLERLFAEPPLTGRPLEGIAWHPDGRRFTYLEKAVDEEDAPSDLWACDLETGQRGRLVQGGALRPGGNSSKPIPLSGYQWSPDGSWLLLIRSLEGGEHGPGEAWRLDPPEARLARLLEGIDGQVPPHFAPGGDLLAFIRLGNLWTRDLATGAERCLTRDGSDSVLNGKLDWVTWEELGHRKSWRAFEWSPDGKKIAFIRLDQSDVPEYPLVDAMEVHPRLTRQRYPKAGDPNAVASVHIVRAVDDERRTTDDECAATGDEPRSTARHGSTDGLDASFYVGPELAWTPDSAAVAFTLLARDQRSLELRLLPGDGSADRLLLKERDPHWLNHIGPPLFLPAGDGFLWVSEAGGRAHLYRHSMDGGRTRALTAGDWQVERVHGIRGGRVYLTGTGTDPRERHLYRARLDGSGFERLTNEEAVHSVEWQPEGRAVGRSVNGPIADRSGGDHQPADSADEQLDPPTTEWCLVTSTSPGLPPVSRLFDGDGRPRTLVREPAAGWQEYDWAEGQFIDVAAEDGTVLHGRLLQPRDFDPARRYPVVVHVYGGPHAQVVQKSWAGSDPMEQLLAQEGILIWRLDNRGSWGRGHTFESPVDRRLGTCELADQLAGVRHLKSLPFVDGDRIGIFGWSYGGFLTLYALTKAPEIWRCGAAGAPVTDWKFYDSIYTERYMGMPMKNPDGYRAASPLEAAAELRAPLLLIHGTDDDNVHLQNTLQFVEALSRHRKPYELVLQPGQKHGLKGRAARTYAHERLVGFFVRHLLG